MTRLKPSIQSSRGISLVEIIIVIAISGLFISVILMILPRAQVGRRDSQRKAYLLQVAVMVDKYKEAAANRYQYPPVGTFPADFGGGGPYNVSGNDPLADLPYTFAAPVIPNSGTPAGIGYTLGQGCNGPGSGLYSLTIGLEAGTTYCIDNH